MEGLWCGLLWVFQCSPGQRTSTGKGVEMYEVQLPSEAFTVRDSAERQLEPASEQDLRRAISNRQGSIRAEALYCVSWYRLVYSMKLNLVSKTAILPYRSSINPLLLSWPPSPSEKAMGATGSSILIIQIELASFLIDHVQFSDVFLVQVHTSKPSGLQVPEIRTASSRSRGSNTLDFSTAEYSVGRSH
ncbi:hypothetical protein EDD17DRAFT_1512466 [Pisolithus thermaeus]|nr:hypothetical protein EV401DRAFT_1894142 [Pisolithus croceorrhizus]KAI6156393.1 hypothetical protein EDD17DRAFT_1512466 [Pisolithus thermaeus]